MNPLEELLEPYRGLIVDVHAHIGPDQRFLLRCSVDDLVEAYDSYGIRVGLASSTLSLLADYALGNEMILEAVRKHPSRVYGLYAMNPFYRDAIAELKVYVGVHGFRGVKFHPQYFGIEPSETPALEALEAVAKLRVPLMLHSYDGGVEAAKVAETFPDLTVIAYHAGGIKWREAINRFKRFDNVYVEISSSVTDRGMVKTLVEALGSDRVLFGTDIPYLDPAVSLGKVLGDGLGEDDLENVLFRNAQRLKLVD